MNLVDVLLVWNTGRTARNTRQIAVMATWTEAMKEAYWTEQARLAAEQAERDRQRARQHAVSQAQVDRVVRFVLWVVCYVFAGFLALIVAITAFATLMSGSIELLTNMVIVAAPPTALVAIVYFALRRRARTAVANDNRA